MLPDQAAINQMHQDVQQELRFSFDSILKRTIFLYIAAALINDDKSSLINFVCKTLLLAPAIEYFVRTFHPENRLLVLVALMLYGNYRWATN